MAGYVKRAYKYRDEGYRRSPPTTASPNPSAGPATAATRVPGPGAQVTASNAPYNATIGAGGSVSFGFNGTWSGANAAPTVFTFNGATCAMS